jgi:hypothetical protein
MEPRPPSSRVSAGSAFSRAAPLPPPSTTLALPPASPDAPTATVAEPVATPPALPQPLLSPPLQFSHGPTSYRPSKLPERLTSARAWAGLAALSAGSCRTASTTRRKPRAAVMLTCSSSSTASAGSEGRVSQFLRTPSTVVTMCCKANGRGGGGGGGGGGVGGGGGARNSHTKTQPMLGGKVVGHVSDVHSRVDGRSSQTAAQLHERAGGRALYTHQKQEVVLPMRFVRRGTPISTCSLCCTGGHTGQRLQAWGHVG